MYKLSLNLCVCGCHSIYCIYCFPLIIVVEVEVEVVVLSPVVVMEEKKTRGRAVVGDPLAFLTVVMKNYYETIISFSVSSRDATACVLSFQFSVISFQFRADDADD